MRLLTKLAFRIRRALETDEATVKEKLKEKQLYDTIKKQDDNIRKQNDNIKRQRKTVVKLEKKLRETSAALRRLNRGAFINAAYVTEQRTLPDSHGSSKPSILNLCEAQVYSQNGEDGILLALFDIIGTTNRTFVEIGAGGLENNTNNLFFNHGWRGLWIDLDANCMEQLRTYMARNFPNRIQDATIQVAKVTRDNINQLIADNCTEQEPDLLTIDVDGNDAHLLRALNVVRPRVLMVEYNASFGLRPITIPYDPDHDRHEVHAYYYGASLTALAHIAQDKGYELVCCDTEGVNVVFVRSDAMNDGIQALKHEEAFMPQRRRTRILDETAQWEFVKDLEFEQVDRENT